jgi:hypothetical protein
MKALLIVLTIVTLFTSCRFLGGERISGNGNIVNVQRNVGSFNSIEAGGAVEVRIKQDETNSVRVETDENLLEYLDISTDGNTLVIRTRQGFNLRPSRDVIVYATAPRFVNLDISGASKLIGQGTLSGDELELGASGASEVKLEVKVDKLQADLSGSSTLQVKGEATRFSTQGSGASEIKCMDLITEETTLDLSGASNAEVTANKQLTIDASGASDVRYRGNANINQKSSGASSVKKI